MKKIALLMTLLIGIASTSYSDVIEIDPATGTKREVFARAQANDDSLQAEVTPKVGTIVAGTNVTVNRVGDEVTVNSTGGVAPVDSVNGQTGVVVLDKTDIGLTNADDTSDVNKPVSTATQTEIDTKEDTLPSVSEDVSFLTSLINEVRSFLTIGETKTALSIENVDNTSDANKPVSTATQTALDTKVTEIIAGTNVTVDRVGNDVTVNSIAAGTGDVVGPAVAVDGNIPTFDTTTGKLLKDSGATIDINGISTPAVAGGGGLTIKDDSAPSATDKAMSQVLGAYVDGADTAENGSLSFWAKIAGTMTNLFDYNPSTDTVDFDKDTTLQIGDIVNDEIADGTIEADKLEATNAPTDNYIPSYDLATGGHTWVPNGAGSDPTIQDADPTSASGSGFYVSRTSEKLWYKDPLGLLDATVGVYTLDPIIPTLTSATIPTSGDTISLLFSEAITVGSGGNAGWTLNTPTNVMTYFSGDTGTTFVYDLASTINTGDTPTITYTQPGDGLESSTGGDLASFDPWGGTVTNNSTQSAAITISYVASAPGTAATDTDVTAVMPVGTTDGMILNASIQSSVGTVTFTPPAGWIEVENIANGTDTIQYNYYKIASSETGPYTFVASAVASGLSLHIATFSKTSGTWVAPTGVNLSNTSNPVSATCVTGSVTIPESAMLVCSFGNDGAYTPTTPPVGMTEVSTVSAANVSLATYYESGLSGATTKTMVWPAGDQTTSIAVVLGAE